MQPAGVLAHTNSIYYIRLVKQETNQSRLAASVPSDFPPLKIAASSYLNSAPLIWSFLHGSMRGVADFVDPVSSSMRPIACAGRSRTLHSVPVIEYQRIPDISLLPDVCVASKREVRSVILVSRK